MIELCGEVWEVSCDECPYDLQLDKSDYPGWRLMINAIKAEGWKIFREEEDYSHICPDCVAIRKDCSL